MQYRDIDRAAKVIHITKSVYYDNNRPMLKTPKTAAGKRDIILLEKLAEHIPNGAPEDYLFGWDGALMTQSQFDRSWKAYRTETGLTLTPHQLRHAFATILFEAGIDEKDAQELLGHTSLAMTRDIYTHIRSSRKEKTAAALNQFVRDDTP
ncbi:MAG: site-specific integrase [Candidatus Merdivicinus sp.]